jgi:ATP-dependent 26S proteasome regulatory subunit
MPVFLGDHLKLHVIATTNASVRQLDPAILRPDRFMGACEFSRLTCQEAQRLAETKGLTLPDQGDYSLAEVYCGAAAGFTPNRGRQLGLAQ